MDQSRAPLRPPAHRSPKRWRAIPLLLVATWACTLAPLRPPADGRLAPDALATQLAAAAPPLPLPPSATPQVIAPDNLPAPPPNLTPTPSLPPTPGEPPPYASRMTDLSSAALAGQARTNADYFEANLMERPLSGVDLDYLGYLDIAPGAEISFDDTWVYVSILLVSPPPEDAAVNYGLEIDLNFDGRGDWLILTRTPDSIRWATGAALAYLDKNGDVGGRMPMTADGNPGDGYELLVYAAGAGQDPEALWSRISPANPSAIQIAFKRVLIGNVMHFAWGAWADGGPMRPEWFDYNDHFSIQLIVEVAEVREIVADVRPVDVQLELGLRLQIPNDAGLLHGLENFIMPGLLFGMKENPVDSLRKVPELAHLISFLSLSCFTAARYRVEFSPLLFE